MSKRLFSLGQIVITSHATEKLCPPDVAKALARHARGDWGDLCVEDIRENDWSLHDGGRLLSAYHDARRTKFWVITEADRSATTVLLPEDY